MIVPGFAAAEGDTCPEDTARRYIREYNKEVDPVTQHPIYKARKLMGWYWPGDEHEYYKVVLELLESGIQDTQTPTKIGTTNSMRI